MEVAKIFDNLKSKNISESSLKLYLANLKRLNGGEVPKTFTFLKDVDKILDKIKDYKPNTRRSYLISVVSLLKQEPKLKKLYDKYYTILDQYNKALQTNNTKSETQKENWMTQEQVQKVYSTLTEEVVPLFDKKKLSVSEYDQILYWMVLSLYTLQPPRRNLDYQHAVVVNKYTPEMDKKFNYLDLPNAKWYFNNYKTKGTYKTQEQSIPPELMEVIKKYLSFHPLKGELKKKGGIIPFLVDSDGMPFENLNTITRILNKIFGRKVGVSLLRNIYLTDKYGDKVKELNDDATKMGTSASTIENQYVKTDDAVSGGCLTAEV